jgi:hypothetical protein
MSEWGEEARGQERAWVGWQGPASSQRPGACAGEVGRHPLPAGCTPSTVWCVWSGSGLVQRWVLSTSASSHHGAAVVQHGAAVWCCADVGVPPAPEWGSSYACLWLCSPQGRRPVPLCLVAGWSAAHTPAASAVSVVGVFGCQRQSVAVCLSFCCCPAGAAAPLGSHLLSSPSFTRITPSSNS